MIKNFKDKETAAIFQGERSRRLPPDIQRKAQTKLWMIHLADQLDYLLIPPSNHLEFLKGNRKGQHSIRINRQWRVCFYWVGKNAYDVEIVDYH